MFIRNELKEFMERMEVILEEKFDKYQDSWKTVPTGELRARINEQMKAISVIIMSGVDFDKKEVGRKLAHVANYCMFIEYRYRED